MPVIKSNYLFVLYYQSLSFTSVNGFSGLSGVVFVSLTVTVSEGFVPPLMVKVIFWLPVLSVTVISLLLFMSKSALAGLIVALAVFEPPPPPLPPLPAAFFILHPLPYPRLALL